MAIWAATGRIDRTCRWIRSHRAMSVVQRTIVDCAEVGERDPRAAGYAIVDLLFEEPRIAGADLQELDALGQPRALIIRSW